MGIDISDSNIIEFNYGCDGKVCYRMYYTKLDLNLDELKIQEEELTQVKWFSMNELKRMVDLKELNQEQVDFFLKCVDFLKSN